jgi:hypothetical protein
MTMNKEPRLVVNVKGLGLPSPKPLASPRLGRAAETKVELSKTGWIGAIDALRLLAPHFDDEGSVKAQLMLRLSEGGLASRAACWCQEADRGKIDWDYIEMGEHKPSHPYGGPNERTIVEKAKDENSRVQVPKDIFLSSNGWTINEGEADWKRGYFIARKPAELMSDPTSGTTNNKIIRRFVYGLEFHLSEIATLMPLKALQPLYQSDEESTAGDITKKSNAGRNPADAWYDWIAETIIYFNLDGIDTAISTEDFYNLMNRKMNDRKQKSPRKESVEKALRSIKNRWREAKANGEIQD